MSVLHSACKSGDKELVQSLLMDPSSADIEEEDVNCLKAIHYAVKGCVVNINWSLFHLKLFQSCFQVSAGGFGDSDG